MAPVTRIGSDLMFQGDISQHGAFELHGQFQGNLTLNGEHGVLTIAQGARLTGKVTASDVIIHGKVDADITATSVAIHESASTLGSIKYDRIAILGGDNDISLKRNPAPQQ